MRDKIKKAVIPVAGLGTRLLPITKAVPKELLAIVDKPTLQYALEEVVASGIETVILITSEGKDSIKKYLTEDDRHPSHLLESLNKLIHSLDVAFAIQKEPKGLGHAVFCAKSLVGDEPFALLLPDMIIKSDPPCTRRLMNAYEQVGRGVIYTCRVPNEKTSSYGILDVENSAGPLHKLRGLVEKPRSNEAPSNLSIVGRYLLPPSIFHWIEETQAGHGGEIQITDALAKLAQTEGLYGLEYEALIFDTGDKLGYIEANLYFGLHDREMGKHLRQFAARQIELLEARCLPPSKNSR